MGKVIDKRGEGILVYTGNFAIISGILMLVFLHNVPCYVISALLLGYSFGAIQPSLQTMSMHIVSPDRRGAASSTFFCAFDLGIALGGFLAGVLVKYFGYNVMFLGIALSCVCSLVYYFIFGRKHRSSLNLRGKEEKTMLEEPAGLSNLPLVVTISREFGSGGHAIGQIIANKLGVKLYDAELIKLSAKESGLNETFVEANDQMLKRNFLYDLYDGNAGVISGEDPAQTALFYAHSKIIRDLARKESCVIVGRLANFVLKRDFNCFNVFVHADKGTRLQRIVQNYGIDESIAAQELQRIDNSRKEHCLHYTGKEWGKCCYYHLSVDNSLSSDKESAQIIIDAMKLTGKLK